MAIDADRILQTVGGALLTISLALAGWGLTTAVENSTRLTYIEASRFKVTDGQVVWKEIASIRQDLAKMPSMAPPAWLADLVEKLSLRQDKIMERLNAIDGRLVRIEKDN